LGGWRAHAGLAVVNHDPGAWARNGRSGGTSRRDWQSVAFGNRPTIPTRYVCSWEADEQKPEDVWSDFVQRTNSAAAQYIREFVWDSNDKAHERFEPYFNFDLVQRVTHVLARSC